MKDVIEVNYGRKVHEKWKRTHILGIFGGPVPVGTGQSCTGTGSALFFYFDQRSYLGHNLLISDPI